MTNKTINLGGDDTEKAFFKDFEFNSDNGEQVIVKKTFIPGVDMGDFFARHKGRYYPFGLYSRPGFRVLDFPCGSGYAADILKEFDVIYQGMDKDPLAIEYARRVYGRENITFEVADLQNLNLRGNSFDTTG